MIKQTLIHLFILGLLFQTANAQLPPVFGGNFAKEVQSTATVSRYLSPVRILWQTEKADSNIINAKRLLLPGNGQADLSNNNMCILKSRNGIHPALLLDFGKE